MASVTVQAGQHQLALSRRPDRDLRRGPEHGRARRADSVQPSQTGMQGQPQDLVEVLLGLVDVARPARRCFRRPRRTQHHPVQLLAAEAGLFAPPSSRDSTTSRYAIRTAPALAARMPTCVGGTGRPASASSNSAIASRGQPSSSSATARATLSSPAEASHNHQFSQQQVAHGQVPSRTGPAELTPGSGHQPPASIEFRPPSSHRIAPARNDLIARHPRPSAHDPGRG